MSFQVVVDTSVWSEVFRKKNPSERIRSFLECLISDEAELLIPGMVLQEILSYIRDEKLFSYIQMELLGFHILEAEVEDHIYAAGVSKQLSSRGISAKTVDLLISAQSIRRSAPILTLNRDFERIAKHSPLVVLTEKNYDAMWRKNQ